MSYRDLLLVKELTKVREEILTLYEQIEDTKKQIRKSEKIIVKARLV